MIVNIPNKNVAVYKIRATTRTTGVFLDDIIRDNMNCIFTGLLSIRHSFKIPAIQNFSWMKRILVKVF
jgi:hypothetical protein